MKQFYEGELQNLVYKFFLQFSRLEFALKESGFVTSGQRNSAQPDWNAFIEKYESNYQLDKIEAELMGNPPLKQEFKAGKVTWEKFDFPPKASELKNLVFALKTMRNNLFHGGKFGHKSWDDPDRIEFVLSKGLHCITNFSKLDSDLQAHYLGSY
ncbi:hypothetical protein [Vibrio hyugaensis]|uniref:hypothetical protein n=1 Tax=Vibrio hyugaensis TaxID=1534743 RepID=UPI000CE3149D|nr:hypothetical protein [Vibrio hyugaensis]